MLKVFRSNTKIIIWITVIALALLFGAGSIVDLVSGKKSGRFAGEAFGKTVSFQEYNQFYRATQLFMPAEKPLEDPELLRQYTWQNIIYSREAKHNNIKVTDEEVRDNISNILKKQGLVSPTQEQYKIWLTRSLRMSPRDFEEGLREFMRIQKLLQVKIAGFTPPGADKLTDTKAKEEAEYKQKAAFMAWTTDVNKRAAFKDYLTSAPEDMPETVEKTAPVAEPVPAAKPVPAAQPAPAVNPAPAVEKK
jgi:hypothetical protein